ncbi:MAG: carboxypeptidase regulatory-like domain-containing protein [Bryobacteraceae bacterium]|nr:carboxypeptidase regulatory-like domain-containing protein [Bryobacteraceae bacterium]
MSTSLIWMVPLVAGFAFGQAQSNSGDIRGTILDASGAAVAGARINLSDPDRGLSRSTESDAGGNFTFAILPPGRYRVRVEAAGFAARLIDGVEVRVGDTVSLPVQMTVSQVDTTIEVQAGVEVVEVERVQQANTIEQARIRNLPINRRNYLDFALLAPGVVETTSLVDDVSFRPIQTPNSGLSFGGSNGRGNGFYIDGVENYLASAGVRPSVTQEMAQEFQINRNSFSAEFGNASGGVVNIITKSGSNDWRGNLFGFLRHKSIQARNYFDSGKSPFTRVQAGATLGGAIKKDKTFLFMGFERLDRNETAFVPILQDRTVFNRLTPSQQQLVDFFTATGNPLLVGLSRQAQQLLVPGNNPALVRLFTENSGVFPFYEDQTTFGIRLDHRFSDRHNAFFRGNTTKIAQENANFGALDGYNRGRLIEQSDATAMVSDTFLFNPRWLMETRLMFNYNTFDVTPNDPLGPELNITGFGLFGRQIFVPFANIERHYQVIQNFNYLSGKHNIKFGYDVNPMRNTQISATFLGGRFSFGEAVPLANALVAVTGDPTLPQTLTGVLTQAGRQQLIPNLTAPLSALQAYSLGLPTFFQQGFGDPNYVNFIKRFHTFVQDNWKVAPSLSLNLGLRYELEVHNAIIPKDRNNIGPRFGFAWSPGGDGRTAVRGGYGLYYAQINSTVAGTADPLSGRFINQVFVPLTGIPGFNNALTGRPLTSADIYQTLLRQGVIGRRPIAESDLAQFGVRVGPGLPLSVIFGVDQDFENPWAHQASLEVERAIGDFAVSAAYNFNRGAHLQRTLGRNVAYTGQRLPDGRPTFTRINPLVLQRNIITSDANSFYHAGILQLTRRFTRGFTLNTHYTFSKAIDESTDFNSDYSPNDQLNARAERSLSPFHQAHRFVLSAVMESPFKSTLARQWTVSPIASANSWRPFNVLTGVDQPVGGDGYVNTKRPAHLGRNAGRGPNFFTIDLRLARRFPFSAKEHRNVEFIAEGFNLLNRTNFRSVNNTVGDVPISALPNPIIANRGSVTTPLAYTSAMNPRQFQFGLKVNF